MYEPSGKALTPEELKEHEQALDMDNLEIEEYDEEDTNDSSSR